MPINVASATETVYTKTEVDDLIASGTGGGVNSVVPGNNIDVDNTDPANPVVSVESLTSVDVTDFVEAAQDAVAAMLAQGTGVTLSYDDTANTLTITGTAGTDTEAVRDAIGVALIGTGVISVLPNDAADTITISSAATQNSTDAALRDRGTHTGTQSADTVVDGTANKVFTAAEKVKLGGVATSATANASDAALRDRGTHTGAQAISTVTGLQAALDSAPRILLWTGTAWPDRPNDTKPTIFVGGTTAPTDVDLKDGDLWVS